jgi:hypothetical protein
MATVAASKRGHHRVQLCAKLRRVLSKFQMEAAAATNNYLCFDGTSVRCRPTRGRGRRKNRELTRQGEVALVQLFSDTFDICDISDIYACQQRHSHDLRLEPMPRPELYPVKKIVGFDEGTIIAIEKWRAKQTPIPNASEAIRWLVKQGLVSASTAMKRNLKAASKASNLAGVEIDRLSDRSATDEERASRKRRLLKGPKEFRDIRSYRAKAKR